MHVAWSGTYQSALGQPHSTMLSRVSCARSTGAADVRSCCQPTLSASWCLAVTQLLQLPRTVSAAWCGMAGVHWCQGQARGHRARFPSWLIYKITMTITNMTVIIMIIMRTRVGVPGPPEDAGEAVVQPVAGRARILPVRDEVLHGLRVRRVLIRQPHSTPLFRQQLSWGTCTCLPMQTGTLLKSCAWDSTSNQGHLG